MAAKDTEHEDTEHRDAEHRDAEHKSTNRKEGRGRKLPRRKKKRPHGQDSVSHERWLVSYADFITLLFTFFVAMYAISRVDNAKLAAAAGSLRGALGTVKTVEYVKSGTQISLVKTSRLANLGPIGGSNGYSDTEREKFQKLAAEIQSRIHTRIKGRVSGINESEIKFILQKRGLVIRVSEHLFFRSGDASILPEFVPILNILGEVLERIPNHIRIEGHTDDVPIDTPTFPSNWELSTARATNVLHYLLTQFRFTPDNLSATGYAEFRPVRPNKTPEERFQNRRVDLVVLAIKGNEI